MLGLSILIFFSNAADEIGFWMIEGADYFGHPEFHLRDGRILGTSVVEEFVNAHPIRALTDLLGKADVN